MSLAFTKDSGNLVLGMYRHGKRLVLAHLKESGVEIQTGLLASRLLPYMVGLTLKRENARRRS